MPSHQDAPEEQPALLDRHQLRRLCRPALDDASAFLAEVLALFVEYVPPRLAALRDALESLDRTGARQLAVHLGAWSVTVGAREMTRLCDRVGECAAAMDLDGALLALDRLAVEFGRVAEALERGLRP